MLRRFALSYADANASRPLLTKSVTSGVLLSAGDVLCQTLQPSPPRRSGRSYDAATDWARTGRMFGWGLLVNGPCGHAWYAALDRLVVTTGPRAIVIKVAFDQLVYTPPLTLLYFLWQNVLGGDAIGPSCAAAADSLWPTLRVNWVYWSAVHVVTFSLIPLEYRVAFRIVLYCMVSRGTTRYGRIWSILGPTADPPLQVAFVALKNFFWGGFLSYAASRDAPPGLVVQAALARHPSWSGTPDADR